MQKLKNNIKKFLPDSNIVTSPEAVRGNFLSYMLLILRFSASQDNKYKNKNKNK